MAGRRDDPDHFTPFDDKNEDQAPPQLRQHDRRGLNHGVRYRSSDSGAEIEKWLDLNCEGKWSIELDGIGKTLASRTFLTMFELESD